MAEQVLSKQTLSQKCLPVLGQACVYLMHRGFLAAFRALFYIQYRLQTDTGLEQPWNQLCAPPKPASGAVP